MTIENLIGILKDVAKVPDLKKTFISKINPANSSSIHIEGFWKFKNYKNDESNTLHSSYIYDNSQNKIHSTMANVLDKRIVLSSVTPCNSKSACLLQDDKCCYLNIFSHGEEAVSINLKDKDVHGEVYNDSDSELSAFSWSPDLKFIVFVAEKKRPKLSSFLSKKPESSGDGWGEKYAYVDVWGEQKVNQHMSVIVVVDTASEEVKVLDLPDGLCGGQVVWTPQGSLVGVAYLTEPYRLGSIYCTNRESVLFHLTLDGNFDELTPRGNCMKFPRFSPDGSSLVFLRGPVGGPHIRSMQICLMKWQEKETVVVIDYVDKYQKIDSDASFYGVCGRTTFPLRCWFEDSRSLVFTTGDHFAAKTYVLNIDSKTIVEVPSKGSMTAYDVRNNYILASTSSLTEPSRIVLVPLSQGVPENAVYISLPRRIEGIPLQWQDQWTFVNVKPQLKDVSESPIPVLYFGPTELRAGETRRPLVVWPHGGPHSAIENTFIRGAAFFVRLGYSVLFPNFRGSLGQGKMALEALPGNCGSLDVDDVFRATLHCLERYKSVVDESKVVLFGGSHGGFLSTHLSAQHPELYKVVSTRNPVIDIASMCQVSDIPDWSYVECGLPYDRKEPPTGEDLSRMHEMSPLARIKGVKAPTLLLLGEEDRRVPLSQGLLYHKMLLARKVPTKACVYKDCHALGKPDIEADSLIQTALWYEKYL